MTERELKENARELAVKNAPRIFIIGTVYAAIVVIILFLLSRALGTPDFGLMNERLFAGETLSIGIFFRNYRPIGLLPAVLLCLLRPLFDTGLRNYCLKIKRGPDAGYKDLLYGFVLYKKVIAIFAVTSVLVLIWSILLIVPGIVAAYRYRLSYYILLDDPSKGVFQCIDESSSMMYGSKLDLCILDISFMAWYAADYILSMLAMAYIPLPFALRIIFILLAPYKGIAVAGFYEKRKYFLAV